MRPFPVAKRAVFSVVLSRFAGQGLPFCRARFWCVLQEPLCWRVCLHIRNHGSCPFLNPSAFKLRLCPMAVLYATAANYFYLQIRTLAKCQASVTVWILGDNNFSTSKKRDVTHRASCISCGECLSLQHDLNQNFKPKMKRFLLTFCVMALAWLGCANVFADVVVT